MAPNDTMHKTPVLPTTQARRGAFAVLVVTASLLGPGVGHVQAAVPGQSPADFSSPNNGGARLREQNVRLAAAAVPKVSVPQVHVNAATHLQPPKISTPQIHANLGTHVNTGNAHTASGSRGAHQLDKNNGDKGKSANTKPGMLLPIEGVSGESTDGHGKSIEIQSW